MLVVVIGPPQFKKGFGLLFVGLKQGVSARGLCWRLHTRTRTRYEAGEAGGIRTFVVVVVLVVVVVEDEVAAVVVVSMSVVENIIAAKLTDCINVHKGHRGRHHNTLPYLSFHHRELAANAGNNRLQQPSVTTVGGGPSTLKNDNWQKSTQCAPRALP